MTNPPPGRPRGEAKVVLTVFGIAVAVVASIATIMIAAVGGGGGADDGPVYSPVDVVATVSPTPSPTPSASPTPSVAAVPEVTTPPPVVEEPSPEVPAEPPDEEEEDAYYANCTEVRQAGAAPLRRGEPGYRRGLDRDGDGVACET